MARIKHQSVVAISSPRFGPPLGSIEEQAVVLNMAKEVMIRIDEVNFINRVSKPVLWHTDLHTCNIFTEPQIPNKICSIIDWQSIVVSPLYLQVRFPEFLSVDEDYVLGLTNKPKPPLNYENMDADDEFIAKAKFHDSIMSKFYEASAAARHIRAHDALLMPQFTRELFIRTGEVCEEGAIPLRACLIEFADGWSELGFSGDCPFSFSEDDI